MMASIMACRLFRELKLGLMGKGGIACPTDYPTIVSIVHFQQCSAESDRLSMSMLMCTHRMHNLSSNDILNDLSLELNDPKGP